VTVGRYAWGVAVLLVTVGSLGFTAVLLRRRFLPAWQGAPARLAESVIGLAALIALSEILGAIGWLRLGPITGASAALAFGTQRAVGTPRRDHTRAATAGAARGADRVTIPLAVVAGAITIAAWAAPTLESFDHGIRGFDSLWYHLPWAASFAQTGHITPLRFTDVDYLSQFYPATSELIHSIGIVLLGRDTLSPVLNLIWLGLSLLAAHCIGRPRGLGGLTVLGAAIAFVTPALVSSQAGSAANDIVGVCFLLAAVALWINAEGDRAALVLAAVAAGLAVGTKLSLLAPVLALTVAVLIVTRRPLRWFVPLVLAGGYWYVRNLIAVGNPIPWTGLGGVLATPAPPLQQNTGFAIVHYVGDPHVWTHFFGPGLVAGLGPWWPLVLALTIAGPLLCLAWPGADRTTRALGAVAVASLLAYLVTPETAAGPAGHPLGFAFNLRYAAPVLALSLSIVPLAPPLARRPPIAAAVLAIVFVLTAIKLHLWSSKHLAGAVLIATACAALAVALARRPPVRAALAGAVALLAGLAIAGYPWQRHYLNGRYAFQPGISALSHVWALFRGVHHARVAVAGTFGMFFAYPLYGLDDSNRVQYIAAHGPHGSFTPIATCRAWRAALDAGGYRYVVATPARDPWHPKPLRYSPERSWIASDPAARIVYERRAFGELIDVFALSGPLPPDGCPARPAA
jgi:hypothetical protein